MVKIPSLPAILGLSAIAGCRPEYEPAPQARVLTTDPLLDAGTLSVGERATLGLVLRSEGAAPVTVRAIEVEGDVDAFEVLPWADAKGALTLPGGSEEAPATAVVQVSYRPGGTGAHRAQLAITSTDSQVDGGIWRVAMRGQAHHPCAAVHPSFLDFGPQGAGSYHTRDLTVENCGPVTLTLTAFDLGGSSTFAVATPDPVYIASGAAETVSVAWVPADDEPDGTTLTLASSDPIRSLEVQVAGNDCEASVDPRWDADGDHWTACGGDCDDTDPEVNPSALELANGADDDCDGATDEGANVPGTDDDGDGWSEEQGDCDDADPAVHPGATETEDARDEDCDGVLDDGTARADDDGDGVSEREGDCDDQDPEVHPGAAEVQPSVDDDCDGSSDEGGPGFDDDGDGQSEQDGDCDDADPWAYLGGPEDCDGVDQDCDGQTDEDDACAYLAERTVDTGAGDPGGCAVAPARGFRLGLLGLLLGLRRRRQSPHAPVRYTTTRPA